MQCPKCGAELTEGAESCPACGEPAGPGASYQDGSSGIPSARRNVVFAGFWLRAIAYIIDSVLVALFASVAIVDPMMRRAGLSTDNPWIFLTGTSRQILAINLAFTMACWLYWSLLESSAWQATLGKKIMGLQVTDLQGRRISLARASGRYFGKTLSTLSLLLGFLMAGFTKKKQALHDLIAGTLVVRNN